MIDTLERQHTVGRAAWAAAWVGLVVGQLHALSRFETADGKEDLELPLTAAWAKPAADAVRPLLDWASADTVYLTYGKIWMPLLVVMTLCAFVVHRRRTPYGLEKVAWRIALTGYVAACFGTFADYWTQWTDYNVFFDIAFAITIPAMLLTVVGSTLLGIALLRRGFRPRIAAVLLTASFPLAILIPQITSLGNVLLPMAFAFGIIGRQLAAEPAYAEVVPA